MRLKKLTLKRLVRLTVALLLILAAVNVAFETLGLPGFLVRKLERRFLEKGLRVTLNDVKAGLIGGVIIEGFEWYDAQLDDHVLFQADFVHLTPSFTELFGRDDDTYKLEVINGRLQLPLEPQENQDYRRVTITQLDAQGFVGSEGGVELTLSGRAFDTIDLDFSFLGTLPADSQAPVEAFSVVPLFDDLPESLVNVVGHIREVARSAGGTTRLNVSADVRGDLSREESLSVNLHLNGASLNYRGIMVEQFQTGVRTRSGKVEVNNCRVQFAGDEALSLQGEYNRKSGMISCEADGRIFPKKFLALGYPQGLEYLKDVQFRDTPASFKLILQPTAVNSLKNARADLSLELRDVGYLNGNLKFLQVTAALKDQVLTAKKFYAVAAPNVEVEGMAVWDMKEETLYVKATQDGAPLSLCQFCDEKVFNEAMMTGFSSFNFSEIARPRFNVEVIVDNKADQLIIAGSADARAFTYNDVAIDSMSASVLVDVTGRMIVIDDLLIYRHGAPGRAQMAIDFSEDNASLQFDAASNIDSSALMQLINSDWGDLLQTAKWRFQETPFALGSGHVNFLNLDDHCIDLTVEAGEVSFINVKADDLKANLQITWPEIKADGTMPSATIQDMTFTDAALTDFIFNEKGVSCLITTESAAVSNSRFSACKGKLKWDPDKPVRILDAKTDSIKVGANADMELVLSEINCPEIKISDDGAISAKGTVKEIREQLIKSNREILSARMIKVDNFSLTEGLLLVEGEMEKFRYPALKAKAENASYRSILKNHKISSNITVPKLMLENGTTMTNVEVDAVTISGRTKAGFNIKTLEKASVTAKNFSGKIEHEGEAFRISEGNCEVMEMPPFRLSNAKLDALSAFETITARVNGGELAIVPKTETDKDGKKRYPMEMSDVQADMVYKNNVLNISRLTSPFYTGKVKASARLHIDEARADATVNLHDVDLKKLMERGGQPDDKDSIVGRFSASASLDLNYKDDLMIFGLGQAKVRDGSLWKMPLISDFLGLLNAKVGKITKLDCDLRFEGDRMDIVDMYTNGTLVSLQGNGFYWWKTEGIDMRFRADILKTWLLKSVFKKRLYGDLDNYEWEDFTPIFDLFRSENPVDPTTVQNK